MLISARPSGPIDDSSSSCAAQKPDLLIHPRSEAKQQFTNGRLVLRGSRDFRNLMCIDTQSGGGANRGAENVLTSASIGYRGELMVVCVPKGSVWEIQLSDVPFVKTVESFDAYIARISGRRERELVPVTG